MMITAFGTGSASQDAFEKPAMIWHPSSNFSSRPENQRPHKIVLHYTECDKETSLRYLCHSKPPHRVSAHYLVDQTGHIYHLVKDHHAAWHAGKSYWQGHQGLNDVSLGIEIVNDGISRDFPPFPQAQMTSVAALVAWLQGTYHMGRDDVVGHCDIAPGRKIDPGPRFPWPMLAQQGLVRHAHEHHEIQRLLSNARALTHQEESMVRDVWQALEKQGYGSCDPSLSQSLAAFLKEDLPLDDTIMSFIEDSVQCFMWRCLLRTPRTFKKRIPDTFLKVMDLWCE